MNFLLLFATSFYVLTEPSPFDLGVASAVVIIVAKGDDLIVPGMWPAASLICLFLLTNIFPVIASQSISYHDAFSFTITDVYLLFLFYLVAAIVYRYGHIGAEAILSGCAVAAVVSSAAGIVAFSGAFGLDLLLYDTRAKAFFKDPNVYGPFIGLSIVFILHMYGQKNGRTTRAIVLASLVLTIIGIIISFSRASWVGALVSLAIFYGAQFYRRGFGILVRYAVVTVVALCAVGSVAGSINPKEMDNLFSLRLKMQDYDEDRFYVQNLAIEKSSVNPLGVGPGQSEIYFPLISKLGTGATHSLFVRLIFENGWFGALSFCLFLIMTMYVVARCAFRDSSSSALAAMVFAALAGTIVQSFVIDTLHWRHLWILLGAAWGLHAHDIKILARRGSACVGAARL